MKNKLVMGIFIFFILLSLIVPKIALFLLEDNNIDKIYKSNINILKNGNINDENVLIKTIYAKYNGEKYSVKTTDTYEIPTPYYEVNGEKIKNEELVKLQELEKIGLLKKDFFTYLEKNKYMIARISAYESDNMDYSKIKVFLSSNDFKIAFMSFEVEHKTGKIIALKVPKEYVNVWQEVINNYIAYLGFSKKDWIYETNSIISLVNKLEIKVENINSIISISIVPYN